MESKFRAATETTVYLLVVTAIIVVGNILSMRFLTQHIDMTESERFTLSNGSKHLVCQELQDDMLVEVYASKGLAKNDVFIQDLTDLLKQYENATYEGKDENGKTKVYKSHIHYSIIDPKTDDQKKAAKDANLQEQTFAEGSQTGKDQATFAKGFMGIVFKYGTEQGVIPAMPTDDTSGLEFLISNQIREQLYSAESRKIQIGVISGKDELKLSDNDLAPTRPGQEFNIKGVFQQYMPFYEFQDVDLQNGDAEINRELKGLIITQPGKDFTEKELRRIDQFLMLGGHSLVVFASAVNMKNADPTMRATLNTHGLEKLLDGYGVEMKKDAVLDWTGSFALQVQTASGPQGIRMPWAIQATPDDSYECGSPEDCAKDDKRILDKTFAPFFRANQIPIPFASTLIVHKDKQPNTRVRVVARSYPNATADTTENIDMLKVISQKPVGEKGQKVIAVALEAGCCDGTTKCKADDLCKKGTLKSAFSGDNMGVEAESESKGPDQILVVSSSEFLANPFARAGNPPPMPPQMQMMGAMGGDQELQMIAGGYYQESIVGIVLTLKNTLDWMSGEQDMVATSAKLASTPNLKYTDVKKPEIGDSDSPEDIKKKMDAWSEERSALQSKVQWTLTLLPAFLFAVFGIVRWRLREASRNSISLN